MFGNEEVGLGFVGRTEDGWVAFAGAQRLRANWGAAWAEFATVRFGVSLAHRLNYGEVIVKSDAIKVMTAIH